MEIYSQVTFKNEVDSPTELFVKYSIILARLLKVNGKGKKSMINLIISEKVARKKITGRFKKCRMNYLTEFDLYVDISLTYIL